MANLHVLILTPWFPNRLHPQHGNFVERWAELVAREHTVTLVAVSDDGPDGSHPSVETTQKDYGRVIHAHYAGGARTRVQRIYQRSKAWALAEDALPPADYDLIHAHVLIDGGIVAERWSRKLDIPFVVTEHSHRYLKAWPVARLPDRFLARKIARHAAALLPVSPSLLDGMRSHGLEGNYAVLPNPVDEQLFRPSIRPRPRNRPFVFVHLSDYTPNKNFALLLKAYYRFRNKRPNVHLHFAGNGAIAAARAHAGLPPEPTTFPELDELLALDDKSRPALSSSGPHAPEDVVRLLSHYADTFVLTSDYETQSIVLIEALLCGIPCISTDCGGPRNILTNASRGRLVPVDNANVLAQTMLKSYWAGKPGPTDRARRAEEARREYSTDVILDRLNQIYREALGS